MSTDDNDDECKTKQSCDHGNRKCLIGQRNKCKSRHAQLKRRFHTAHVSQVDVVFCHRYHEQYNKRCYKNSVVENNKPGSKYIAKNKTLKRSRMF